MEASLPTTSGELTEALKPTRRLRFGIKTAPQYTTYDDILRVWREADQIPVFEHAWVFDHLIAVGDDPSGPCLEGWTLLSALAAATERLRVGVMVTSNTFPPSGATGQNGGHRGSDISWATGLWHRRWLE